VGSESKAPRILSLGTVWKWCIGELVLQPLQEAELNRASQQAEWEYLKRKKCAYYSVFSK